MSAGTIIAQMINVLVQPLLTRIVPAETLGEYSFLISLATMIIPVASLKIDMLIVSEENDDFAQYITDVCIILCIAISTIYLAVIGTAYCLPTENIFNRHGPIIFVVPLCCLLNFGFYFWGL